MIAIYSLETSRLTSRERGDNVEYGTWVRIWSGPENNDREIAWERWVGAATRYEPTTRNRGGTLGAYRDIPNTDAITLAEDEARAFAVSHNWDLCSLEVGPDAVRDRHYISDFSGRTIAERTRGGAYVAPETATA